jgi:hypothetical protein
VTNDIQNLLQVDWLGSVVVAEMIKASKQLDALNHVGLAELILTGGWYLWWERRKLVHGDTVQNPTRSAMAIATLTTNYQRAVKKMAKKKEGWKKPPEGNLLLNVDASYNQDRGTGSTGAVIRDSSGSFIAAAARFIEHGCNRLMIQSDSLEVVETMKQDGISATTSAPVYDECAQLWQDFVYLFLLNIVIGKPTK